MVTERAGNFLTHRSWFREVITENVVLCGTSALEMLEMFNGLVDEGIIDVYALSSGRYENIDYHIIDAFAINDYIVSKIPSLILKAVFLFILLYKNKMIKI